MATLSKWQGIFFFYNVSSKIFVFNSFRGMSFDDKLIGAEGACLLHEKLLARHATRKLTAVALTCRRRSKGTSLNGIGETPKDAKREEAHRTPCGKRASCSGNQLLSISLLRQIAINTILLSNTTLLMFMNRLNMEKNSA
jgi:hypothetical protein